MDKKAHYAGIDIGSNAVRLLIKCENEETASERLSKVQLLRVPLRLGEDAFTKGRIGKKKSKQLVRLMKAFRDLMRIYNVRGYRACATSAMRDASNGAELVEVIRIKSGISIDIIDGQEEARLISSDLIADQPEGGTATEASYLYIDVGGGSTELNIVLGKELVASRSFNIGTVRLLKGIVPDETWAEFRAFITEAKANYPTLQIVGTGGNINKLLRLGAPAERSKMNKLPVRQLLLVHNELSRYETEERMIRFGLKPDRADVILPAAEIFITASELVGNEHIIVPTKGLSDGIVDYVYQQARAGR